MAFSRGVVRFALVAAVMGGVTAGCVEQPAYEKLDAVTPIGSDFSKALFKDYAYLSRSFGGEAATAGTTFDADSSIPVTDYTADVTDLANAFADKAIVAGRGEEVVVEPAPEDDNPAQVVRMQALKDIDAGRDKAPDDAARVQTDYDCWIMNDRVDSQKEASLRCRHSLDRDMAALESKVGTSADTSAAPAPDANAPPPDNSSDAPADNSAAPAPATAPTAPTTPVTQTPAPPPAAAPAPAPAAQAAPPPAETSGPQYTLYFAVGSTILTSEDIAVVQHAMEDARQSGAGHIVIVGHADASESHAQALSDARADAVRNLMMQMGARYEAIQVSGTGAKDLAVRARGKEPRNRRAIIMLTP